jgi:hypothetical protein
LYKGDNFQKENKNKMKKILLALTITVIFTACGKGGEGAGKTEGTSDVNSTTPPPTSDTTNPIGVMMSDTSTTAADSLNNQK